MNTNTELHGLIYTPRAEKVIRQATKEASDRHQFVEPEHVLMAIIRIQEGIAHEAINILLSKNTSRMCDLATTLDKQTGWGSDSDRHQQTPPYTPRARRVLSLATKEAQKYSHRYIGTENILLAIMAEGESVAFKVLTSFGLTYNNVRDCIMPKLMGAKPDQQSTPKTEKTMKDTERTLKISDLIAILELNGSGHSENVCKNLELLKQAALMDLSDLGEFSGDEGLNRLISQLSSDNRGTPTPGWFKGMVTKESIDLIVEILRRNHGNTAEEKLRQVLNLTDHKSEEETRICRILQVLTNSDTIERTIRIHR